MKTALLLLPLLLTAPLAHAADGLQGVWTGTYATTDDAKPVTVFLVSQAEKGSAAFEGRCMEKATFGDKTSPSLEADIIGIVDDDGGVHMHKRYDGRGGQGHGIWYLGKLSENGTVFSGTWYMRDDWHGTFTMRKIADQ